MRKEIIIIIIIITIKDIRGNTNYHNLIISFKRSKHLQLMVRKLRKLDHRHNQ